ncbi:MAG: XRE family transcriptional regulator [Pseudomonadota bacterium]
MASSAQTSALENLLGADIRTLRRARKLTLEEMAQRLDRSIGWMSQVERGLSQPEPKDVSDIARVLGISPDTLPAPGADSRVVRAQARRPVERHIEGLTETLLSPDLSDAFEMVHSVFAPGAAIDSPAQRATQEVAYIQSGQLSVQVGGERFDLGPGDSIRLRGEPFTWANPGPSPCVAIWVIAPPVY